MMEKHYTALGLMSGSSLDGLDVAAVRFALSDGRLLSWTLLGGNTYAYSGEWQERLRRLPESTASELMEAHVHLGHYLGGLVLRFLEEHDLEPDLIASHGHTIFHYPDRRFTTQIGDGAALAMTTGYPVICDFRASDVALGGQGAPLAPLADKVLFPDHDAYLNLGGIANLTCRAGDRFVAFDVTGANQVLNALVATRGLTYDDRGRLATSGKINERLLTRSEELPFFSLDYPKSLGNDWVQRELVPRFITYEAPLEDKLRTACVHVGRRLAADLRRVMAREDWRPDPLRLFITGGGARNDFLVQAIREECEKICSLAIEIPTPEIVDFKESLLMALMGVLRLENQPNCLASVTGARFDTIGGAVYQGWRKRV